MNIIICNIIDSLDGEASPYPIIVPNHIRHDSARIEIGHIAEWTAREAEDEDFGWFDSEFASRIEAAGYTFVEILSTVQVEI